MSNKIRKTKKGNNGAFGNGKTKTTISNGVPTISFTMPTVERSFDEPTPTAPVFDIYMGHDPRYITADQRAGCKRQAARLSDLCVRHFERFEVSNICKMPMKGCPDPATLQFVGDVIGRNRFTGETVTIPQEHASWLLAVYSHEDMNSPDFPALLDHVTRMVSGKVYMAMLD